MERPEAVQNTKNKRRNKSLMEEKATKKMKSTASSSNGRKTANLRIHHAYVHASLFKDFASINPEQLPSGKWKIDINFKNNKSVSCIVENEKDLSKWTKKILEYQKKYGTEAEQSDDDALDAADTADIPDAADADAPDAVGASESADIDIDMEDDTMTDNTDDDVMDEEEKKEDKKEDKKEIKMQKEAHKQKKTDLVVPKEVCKPKAKLIKPQSDGTA